MFHPNTSAETMNPTANKRRWWALVFISISLLVISLDNTIVNVALPSISRELSATASDLQWIVDAYVLVFAALLLTMGAIGDRYGRKRALQFGLVWFALGSIIAALSNSTEMLILARALLGIGGATIMPATLSLLTATFSDPKERATAIAFWAAVFGLGVGLGPLIGGLLLEYFEWTAVFYINLPVVVIALAGGQYFIAESKDEDAAAPDIPGALLSIGGLFALVYGIIEAGVDGWTADHVLVAFAAAFILLGAFTWWEARTPNPMLPLALFRNMSFTVANIALTLVMFAMFGSLFFLSQFFQSVQGYTALETGVRLLPMALTIMFFAGVSAQVSARLGIKLTVAMGILVASGGLFYFSQFVAVDSSYSTVLLGLLLIGAGMGTAMSPATNSVMGSVPVSRAGVGSAMNDTTRQLGGALGVAVLGTIMNDTYRAEVNNLPSILAEEQVPALAMQNIPLDMVEKSIQAAHGVAARLLQNADSMPIPGVGPKVSATIIQVADGGFVEGMGNAMLVGSMIMLAAALFAFAFLPATIRRPVADGEHKEQKSGMPGLVSPEAGTLPATTGD